MENNSIDAIDVAKKTSSLEELLLISAIDPWATGQTEKSIGGRSAVVATYGDDSEIGEPQEWFMVIDRFTTFERD